MPVAGVETDSEPSDADQDIDALIAGVRWTAATLTFGFPESPDAYGYGTERATGFAPMTAAGRAAMRAALADAAAVSGLVFEELGDDPGEDPGAATIRIARTGATATGWAYYPSTAEAGGDIWLSADRAAWDRDGFDSPVMGRWGWFTLWHELGHALGLRHGHETDGPGAMTADHDGMEFSVMTYRSHPGGGTGGYTNEPHGYAQGFMTRDIAALQRLYGPNYQTNAGDTVYRFSPQTGEMFVDGLGQGAPGANRIFRTIWDGGGIDCYDLSDHADDLVIDLAPGAASDFSAGSHAQNARLGSGVYARGHVWNALLFEGDRRALIENARGGAGDDVISGNDAANDLRGNDGDDRIRGRGWHDRLDGGAGDDRLRGGGGDDVLIDGAGVDRLWGGAGADVFILVRDDSRDVIRDWQPGETIDLSAWDLPDISALRIREHGPGKLVLTEAGGGERLAIISHDLPITAADIADGVLIFA